MPQQDLQILGVGGGPSMIAALENGQIDVACNTSPTTDLMVKRGKAIMFTHNSTGKDPAYDDFLFELLYVRPDFAKANPDTVRAFCRALLLQLRISATRRRRTSFRCCANALPGSKTTCWWKRSIISGRCSGATAR